MRISKNHLGIGFEVWNSQESWFWFVESTNRNGMIGAAASESEAESEARSSIEEIASPARGGWEGALGNLARYLACVCDATA
jgi:hypothetical protein